MIFIKVNFTIHNYITMLPVTSKVNLFKRKFCSFNGLSPTFGLIFDIDGVIARGRNVLPKVTETFHKYIVKNNKFCIPSVFLTNSSNGLTRDKAHQLSEWLQVQVPEEQVILAHSPLKLCTGFHKKNIFLTGQGPLEDIARGLGFTKITTVDDMRKVFPQFDIVDHERRKYKLNQSNNSTFSKIDAIILLGEPIRWETALQLVTDLLLSDGDPRRPPCSPSYPHIPVLACNPDLQYMAEAHMPRFGHGSFLLCLESLYKKLTGNELIYNYLVGKPSDITFRFAQEKILEQARKMSLSEANICNMYTIGDNVNTDIFGANLFNEIIRNEPKTSCNNIKNSFSVLVKTGVYNGNQNNNELNHMHRDFLHLGKCHYKSTYTVEDVNEAIELIIKLEKLAE